MSPIFVRPVREQLEHDRLIRHLQTKYKRKFEVGVNLGDEQVAPVKIGPLICFPDLVLTSGKKLAGLVEVESGESVNNLEAMAQWVRFSRARVPFHLYVPVHAYDAARRLCDANQARVAEVWTYRSASDEFDLVRMFQDPSAIGTPPRAPRAAPAPVAVPVVAKKVAKPVVAAKPAPRAAAKPSRTKPKPATKTKAKPSAKPNRTAVVRRAANQASASRKKAAPAPRSKTTSSRKKR